MDLSTAIHSPKHEPDGNGSRRYATFEEFLEHYDDDETHKEWVDGEVIIMSPASIRHQLLAGFLGHLLAFYAEACKLGVVLTPPYLMRLRTRPSGREPDLLFIANTHRDRMKETYLDGPADLAIEIVSPDSMVRDRSEKFSEYERAGIGEYWLIDPLRNTAEFFRLREDGVYTPIDLESSPEGDIFRSQVMSGLWLRPDWLWQEPLPLLFDVLKLWDLI